MDDRRRWEPGARGGAGIDRRAALAGGAALLAAALGAAAPARAQDATPAAEGEAGGLPPGVALVELPELAPFALPPEPGAVRVFWLVMEPDAAIPPHDHPYSEFAVMRSGTAMFRTESGPDAQTIRGASAETGAAAEAGGPGVELTAEAGDVAIFPSGNRSDTRAGAKGAVMLILEIVTQAGAATPAP
jgi:quercetin dioxygenase-like cupin family protein